MKQFFINLVSDFLRFTINALILGIFAAALGAIIGAIGYGSGKFPIEFIPICTALFGIPCAITYWAMAWCNKLLRLSQSTSDKH